MLEVAIGFVGVLLGALIGGGFNWFINSRRIQADLKAKTRLEWIKEVREITAEIIRIEYDIITNIEGYHAVKTINLQQEKKISIDDNFKFDLKLRKLFGEFNKYSNLYKLYFSTITFDILWEPKTNKANEKMHKQIDEVSDELIILIDNYDEDSVFKNYDDEKIEAFRRKTSDYLKREWDRAKENE